MKPNKLAGTIALGLLLGLMPAAGSGATAPVRVDPIVTVVVHVPLRENAGAAIPAALSASYARRFRQLGRVVDHPGIGSWRNGRRLSFDADDHVFIAAPASRVRAFLIAFLPRMKRDLDQQATLAEVFGPGSDAGERRTRLAIVLPLTCLCSAKVRAIHAAFAPAGGASQFDGVDGTHIWSSVASHDVAAVVRKLAQLGLSPAVSPSRFVLVD